MFLNVLLETGPPLLLLLIYLKGIQPQGGSKSNVQRKLNGGTAFIAPCRSALTSNAARAQAASSTEQCHSPAAHLRAPAVGKPHWDTTGKW